MPPFTRISLPFAETNCFEKLILDYLSDEDFLKKFYAFDDDFNGIKQRLDTYSNPRLDRNKLKETVINQYNTSGLDQPDEKVLFNISSLVKPTTFTITAGHQLNIFSGPLYVIFKLISVINLAEKLKVQFPDYHFVPVYWMATEDHDIEEISSVNLFGRQFKWENNWRGVSGKMPLNGIESVINELKQTFGNTAYSEELTSLLESCYLNSPSLAVSTRKWINELLGKYGLVIVDGNEQALKNNIRDILTDEIVNQTSSVLIGKTIGELKQKYHSQAKPREINLFYIGDNFRERIVRENENYNVLHSEINFTKEGITAEINSHPEKFSPNVVLRPLYQVSVLPDIAFVGGPAEIAYWLELKELFNFHHVPMPVLFLRSSALILDKSMSGKIEKLAIKNTELFSTTDELIKLFLLKNEKQQFPFNGTASVISEEFKKLSSYVGTIDPTLKASIESENQKIAASLHTLEEKIIRSLKKKNETEVNQIRKIKDKLFPSGSFQEREESILPFYLNYGSDFIAMLKENLDPLLKQFVILEEQTK